MAEWFLTGGDQRGNTKPGATTQLQRTGRSTSPFWSRGGALLAGSAQGQKALAPSDADEGGRLVRVAALVANPMLANLVHGFQRLALLLVGPQGLVLLRILAGPLLLRGRPSGFFAIAVGHRVSEPPPLGGSGKMLVCGF
eukprot:scaffold7071_cov260-Pinguiococcus_pyrenoidosus.AAC.9